MSLIKELIIISAECILSALKPERPTAELPCTHDGRTGYEIVRKRVLHRFKDKAEFFGDNARYSFEELFNLPDYLSFDEWLFIQLRGRSVDSLFELNIDHIVPLSLAQNIEELKILVSWKNTRLLDPEINTAKASYLDNENILLCEALLNRPPQANWDGHLGRVMEPSRQSFNAKDKFKQLIKNKGKKSKK